MIEQSFSIFYKEFRRQNYANSAVNLQQIQQFLEPLPLFAAPDAFPLRRCDAERAPKGRQRPRMLQHNSCWRSQHSQEARVLRSW